MKYQLQLLLCTKHFVRKIEQKRIESTWYTTQQIEFYILCSVLYLCSKGAYVPLTNTGNLVVGGVLASCYGSFNHDIAHFAMKPVQQLKGMLEWIFGWNNGVQVYTIIVKSVGRYIMPDSSLYVKTHFDRK